MKLMQEYQNKCVSADKAVQVIQSGDWVEFSWGASYAGLLAEAIAGRKEELRDVNFRGGVIMKPLPFIEGDPSGQHFTWNSMHMGGYERKLAKEGMAYYIPIKYSEVPRFIRENSSADVVAIQVAPMDEYGYFSFGVSASHYGAAIEKARHVIVEVNDDMPRVHGGYDHNVHISKVDYIVEAGPSGMLTLATVPESDIDRKIAEYVLPEICDGANIQLGIGGMPNVLGKMIADSDLKNLGVHTELLVDGFMDMVESGVVNGSCKNFDRGRIAFTLALGSQKLYDFMDNNPVIAAYPVDYTNHISTTSKVDNLISINSALEIDLSGQVCSESVGPNIFSGSGGQLDFVEGAYNAKGGKSFICLPSTYQDKAGKTHSRIKAMMTLGSVITGTRAVVQYIVTEYGKVNLKGMSSWQRAEALIGIAHPDFRDQLIREAEELRVWRKK